MPDPSILVSLRGEPGLKVATVTISNPDALNALTTDMQLQFIDAITTLEADDQVRGIIIRGAGEKAFSAGGSIDSLAEIKSPADGEAMYRRGVKMRDTILNMKKPTIAAVSGWICFLIVFCSLIIGLGFPSSSFSLPGMVTVCVSFTS